MATASRRCKIWTDSTHHSVECSTENLTVRPRCPTAPDLVYCAMLCGPNQRPTGSGGGRAYATANSGHCFDNGHLEVGNFVALFDHRGVLGSCEPAHGLLEIRELQYKC